MQPSMRPNDRSRELSQSSFLASVLLGFAGCAASYSAPPPRQGEHYGGEKRARISGVTPRHEEEEDHPILNLKNLSSLADGKDCTAVE